MKNVLTKVLIVKKKFLLNELGEFKKLLEAITKNYNPNCKVDNEVQGFNIISSYFNLNSQYLKVLHLENFWRKLQFKHCCKVYIHTYC